MGGTTETPLEDPLFGFMDGFELDEQLLAEWSRAA